MTLLLFSRAFSLSSLFSVAHCLATAPLKLRPYGAIQICLLLLVVVVCDLTRHVEKLEFLFILLTQAENDASTLLVSVFLTCVHWRDCPSVSLCTRLQRKTFLFVDSIVHNYYVLSVGWPQNSANGHTVIQKVPNILEGSVATHLTCVVGSWMTILLQRLCCGWRWKSRLSFHDGPWQWSISTHQLLAGLSVQLMLYLVRLRLGLWRPLCVFICHCTYSQYIYFHYLGMSGL